jgi:26S proteasome regulatory subunit N9
VSLQLYSSRPFSATELDKAIQFLSDVLENRQRLGVEASLVVELEILRLKSVKVDVLGTAISLDERIVHLDGIKSSLDSSYDILNSLPEGLDPIVSSSYFAAAAEYYKVKGPASKYYEATLQYLGYTPLEIIPLEQRRSIAFELSLSALLGENIYNFGDVNSHPILKTLAGTSNEWLIELLKTFQNGNIDSFQALLEKHRSSFEANASLKNGYSMMLEKIVLLAIMEAASKRPPHERILSYQDIIECTHLPIEKVPFVVMKAFAVGLLKGKIDGVEKVVRISYIAPRVLDISQIHNLKERIDEWRESVKKTFDFARDHSKELTAV